MSPRFESKGTCDFLLDVCIFGILVVDLGFWNHLFNLYDVVLGWLSLHRGRLGCVGGNVVLPPFTVLKRQAHVANGRSVCFVDIRISLLQSTKGLIIFWSATCLSVQAFDASSPCKLMYIDLRMIPDNLQSHDSSPTAVLILNPSENDAPCGTLFTFQPAKRALSNRRYTRTVQPSREAQSSSSPSGQGKWLYSGLDLEKTLMS